MMSSGLETPELRDKLGSSFLTAVPGIRPIATSMIRIKQRRKQEEILEETGASSCLRKAAQEDCRAKMRRSDRDEP
jgi:orotidine-5'-phosphate decarboxylase